MFMSSNLWIFSRDCGNFVEIIISILHTAWMFQ